MMHETASISTPSMKRHVNEPACLGGILEMRAKLSHPGLMIFYPLSAGASSPRKISYATLHSEALSLGSKIANLKRFGQNMTVLIHLDDHWDTILCFWAVLLARGLPVLSSPLSNIQDHRNNHLKGISDLLEEPICITTASLIDQFEDCGYSFDLHRIEALLGGEGSESASADHLRNLMGADSPKGIVNLEEQKNASAACLMPTSGSTGNAKFVCLTHQQILAAVSGKASIRPLPKNRPFLNWIRLDHVASLIEIHIQALWLGVDQIHVHPADVVSSPRMFLELLSNHQVSRSFAPNFFLAKLVAACGDKEKTSGEWDLSNLTVLASGGEANDISTCIAASSLLQRFGAAKNVISTGFGMTETCAGAIFNLECPAYEMSRNLPFATLGHCMPGIEMRVVDNTAEQPAANGVIGSLQVRGEVVFKGYYRNSKATAEAFTADGWFRTGDQGLIDDNGHLLLTGRLANTINVNGIKIALSEFQRPLEIALQDIYSTRVFVFPSRNSGASTEQITVAYVPTKWPQEAHEIANADSIIVQVCMMVSSASRPCVFALSPRSLDFVTQSSLGKVSIMKMRNIFELGTFRNDVDHHRRVVEEFKKAKYLVLPDQLLNDTESALRLDFVSIKGIEDYTTIGPDTSIFDLGFTSMEIIQLKHRIQNRLRISVPIIVLMKNTTIRLLASSIQELTVSKSTDQEQASAEIIPYHPVVTMCATGSKTPLWLVHPGVGEVLVFVALAKHMQSDERPVYALRARGFELGQASFSSITEAVDIYVSAVRERQPRGPYALAGYSYGTMLAFEMAKKLQAMDDGSDVRFLGSFNLPPHIKTRMRQLSWNKCLLHLAMFLGMLDEDHQLPEEVRGSLHVEIPRSEALHHVLANSDGQRMRELGLGPSEMRQWTNVAFGLQSMAIDYEPTGCIPRIDVFHADPLKVAANSRQEWLADHLSRWKDFCSSEPRFHAVKGAHYTMIGSEFVVGFSETLRAALAARGI